MTTTAPDLAVGDHVLLLPDSMSADTDGPNIGRSLESGTNGFGRIELNTPYRITRVSANYIWVRVPAWRRVEEETTLQFYRNTYAGNTAAFAREKYTPAGAPGVDYTPPRKLGTTPEGEHISTDDPRIQWLWADLAKYAENKAWCTEYDKLADAVGIPGRERDFKVSQPLGGIVIHATIKARSLGEATDKLNTQLKENLS